MYMIEGVVTSEGVPPSRSFLRRRSPHCTSGALPGLQGFFLLVHTFFYFISYFFFHFKKPVCIVYKLFLAFRIPLPLPWYLFKYFWGISSLSFDSASTFLNRKVSIFRKRRCQPRKFFSSCRRKNFCSRVRASLVCGENSSADDPTHQYFFSAYFFSTACPHWFASETSRL